MKSVSLCALVWTKLSNPVLTRTGSEGVSELTFYLLELVLAVRVEGSKEQAVPSPVTPTSPIPDTTPHHINWSARQIPLFFFSFFFFKTLFASVRACVHSCMCVYARPRVYPLSQCLPCGAARFLPFCLDKHFLSVNTGEPGTPQFPDVHEYTFAHAHTDNINTIFALHAGSLSHSCSATHVDNCRHNSHMLMLFFLFPFLPSSPMHTLALHT